MSTPQQPRKSMSGPDQVASSRADGSVETLQGVIDLVGVPESAGQARAFVREALGRAHPVLDEVVLLVSELVTNSVTHSDSRGGGPVTLAISECDGAVHVEVVDRGSEREPRVRGGLEEEGGRGLFLVDAISDRWGMYRDGGGRVVWFAVRFRDAGASEVGAEG